jgi:hypothetical protein
VIYKDLVSGWEDVEISSRAPYIIVHDDSDSLKKKLKRKKKKKGRKEEKKKATDGKLLRWSCIRAVFPGLKFRPG